MYDILHILSRKKVLLTSTGTVFIVCQKLSNNWLNQFAKKSKSNLTRRHTCLPQQSLKLRKISNRVSTSYINANNLCDGFDPNTRLKKKTKKLLLSFNFRHRLVVSCILHIFKSTFTYSIRALGGKIQNCVTIMRSWPFHYRRVAFMILVFLIRFHTYYVCI